MDRTERFYKIDRLLKSSKSVSFAKLEEALGLGVSRATLKRDLLYMRDRGAKRSWPECANAVKSNGMDAPAFNGISCAKVEVSSNHLNQQERPA